MNSPITTRHALVTLTALALTGGALVASGGAASAAPADPDLTGGVVNASGTGLAGVEVDAYTTPSDGSAPVYVTSESTDATGAYSFTDLDPESLALGSTNPAVTTETEFKLFFYWSPFDAAPAELHSTGYLDRGLGGTESVRAAGSVVVPANAAATAPTQALPTAAGVLLKVLGSTGAPVTGYGQGTLYEADAYDPTQALVASFEDSGDDEFYPDTNGDLIPDAPLDGLVYISGVEPGKYAVQASGAEYNPTTQSGTSYVSRFFGGNGSYTKAKAVTAAAGAFTPVTVQLSDKLTALEEPRIIGNSSFGSKLKADPGTWLEEQGTEFTYQWLRGTKPVGTGDTYKVTKKDKGKKIKLVVTAYSDTFIGTASADPTSKVGERSKVVVKKLANGKVAVTVMVANKNLAKKLGVPQGKVVLMTEDGDLASKKVRLKGGNAVLAVKAKYAGEKLIVKYLGGGRLGSDTAAVGGGKKK